MLHLKVGKRHAQKAKEMLAKAGMLAVGISVQHRSSYVYFPLSNIDVGKIKKVVERCGASVVRVKAAGRRPCYREELGRRLGSETVKNAGTGFDLLGNIAIIDPRRLTIGKQKALAGFILETNRAIKTVLAKGGPVEGVYRTRSVRYVAGERAFISRYKENGCTFEFDVRKAFFSGRLAYERARVARLARRDRNVVVMFAGIGPFAVEIAKQNRRASIVAIELNRYAADRMRKCIELNKTPNVKPILCDVRKAVEKYPDFADRIVMPLPKTSTRFLDEAHKIGRHGCVVHLYSFVRRGGLEGLIRVIKEHARLHSYRAKVLFARTVRDYSAEEIEIVVDYKMEKLP